MEAAQEIMLNKPIPEEDRLHYSSYLLKKAQEQQEMSEVRSGKLADDSCLCNSAKPAVAAAPAPGGDPAGSSRHNKDDGKPPKKDAPLHKKDGAE